MLSIPDEVLRKSRKILFIAHLALGDFTYLQNCFRALSSKYPHLKIHLFVDELRRTDDARQWPHLAAYSLYDWLEASPYIDHVYNDTYSPELFEKAVTHAQSEDYPIVVSLGVLNRGFYARLARKIAPHGCVAAQVRSASIFRPNEFLAFTHVDIGIARYRVPSAGPVRHISDIYAQWFEQLFSLKIPLHARFPFVEIPVQWQEYANLQWGKWGLSSDDTVVFLNGYSKSQERSWPLTRVIELARHMRSFTQWKNVRFVINVIPEKLAEASVLLAETGCEGAHLFSADKNFFQLPAILSKCNFIISVETAVMHLANAVHVPVIALMRQTSPEWVPFDAENSKVIMVSGRKAAVSELTVDLVAMEASRWTRIVDNRTLHVA